MEAQEILKIMGPSVSLSPHAPREPILGYGKIADDKLQNVSFQNHLVARCYVEELIAFIVSNTVLAKGARVPLFGVLRVGFASH